MTKKQTPTFSQVSYIVTGILAAHTERGDELTDALIEKAVRAAKTASEAITDIVDKYASTDEPSDLGNPFAEYPWIGKQERYTDLANYLKQQGVTSNRHISKLFRYSLEKGYIVKDALTGKYKQGL